MNTLIRNRLEPLRSVIVIARSEPLLPDFAVAAARLRIGGMLFHLTVSNIVRPAAPCGPAASGPRHDHPASAAMLIAGGAHRHDIPARRDGTNTFCFCHNITPYRAPI